MVTVCRLILVVLVGYLVDGHNNHRVSETHDSHLSRLVNTRVGPQFSTKNGSCPSDGFNHMTGIKQCHGMECLTDDSCHGEELCCWYHCEHNLQTTACKLPIGSQLSTEHEHHHSEPEFEQPKHIHAVIPEQSQPVEPENKEPKVCPFVTIKTHRQCQDNNFALQNQCGQDSDCSRGKKCCSNGCPGNPKVCALAELGSVMVKEGDCPAPRLLRCHPNHDRCVTDENCPNNKKCCQGPCGVGLVCTRRAETFRDQLPNNSRRQQSSTTTTTPRPARNRNQQQQTELQTADEEDSPTTTTVSTSSITTASTTTTPWPETTKKTTIKSTTPTSTVPTSPTAPSQQEILQLAQNKINEILNRRFG